MPISGNRLGTLEVQSNLTRFNIRSIETDIVLGHCCTTLFLRSTVPARNWRRYSFHNHHEVGRQPIASIAILRTPSKGATAFAVWEVFRLQDQQFKNPWPIETNTSSGPTPAKRKQGWCIQWVRWAPSYSYPCSVTLALDLGFSAAVLYHLLLHLPYRNTVPA